MCGIVGVIFKDAVDAAVVKQMIVRLSHRGPNEQSVYADGQVVIGFVWFSIVDLTAGHQPIYNEDRTTIAVCNGEIYNHWYERP
jgi:asparagine synthase (glutamine-hydrolysing)